MVNVFFECPPRARNYIGMVVRICFRFMQDTKVTRNTTFVLFERGVYLGRIDCVYMPGPGRTELAERGRSASA